VMAEAIDEASVIFRMVRDSLNIVCCCCPVDMTDAAAIGRC
jgi:hypothetical protein